ncbi:MAG: ATPase, partial [Actinobacteria bacterium]
MAARLIMLVLVAVLVLLATRDVVALGWVGLLAAAGVPAVVAPRHPVLAPLGRFAEIADEGWGARPVPVVNATTGTPAQALA